MSSNLYCIISCAFGTDITVHARIIYTSGRTFVIVWTGGFFYIVHTRTYIFVSNSWTDFLSRSRLFSWRLVARRDVHTINWRPRVNAVLVPTNWEASIIWNGEIWNKKTWLPKINIHSPRLPIQHGFYRRIRVRFQFPERRMPTAPSTWLLKMYFYVPSYLPKFANISNIKRVPLYTVSTNANATHKSGTFLNQTTAH